MKKGLTLLLLILSYTLLVIPFDDYQQDRLFVEKVGYLPTANVLQFCSADQATFLGAWLIGKAVSYYGGLYQRSDSRAGMSPDYDGIYRTLKTGLQLDPYNMDGYYFAQATLVWDMKRVVDANKLLEKGLKYRDWDFYLPFFLGFNNAYFLKNYEQAAKYYKRVAELTGGGLSIRLAGRYLYDSGRLDLAITYLSAMLKGARNDSIKKSLQTRLKAFLVVQSIKDACRRYRSVKPGSVPTVDILVKSGFLVEYPIDPYGGTFYIDSGLHVKTTSNFSYAHLKKRSNVTN